MATYNGYNANVYIASGTPVTFTDEAMTDKGDHMTYTITNSTKRFWSPVDTITVKKDNNVITTGFTIWYPAGRVVFSSSQGTSVITVSGKYIPVAVLGEGTEWTLDLSADTDEVSKFGSAWQNTYTVFKSGSGSITHFWTDGGFLNLLSALMGFELQVDSTKKYVCYGYITTDSINAAADGLIEEPLDFIANSFVYYVD